MKKKTVILVLLSATLLVMLYTRRFPLQTWLIQSIANHSGAEFFKGSIRLNSGFIDRNLKLHLKRVEGNFMTNDGPVPVEIDRLDSSKLVPEIFKPGGVRLQFSGLKPKGSSNPGLSGRTELKAGKEWSSKSEIEIEGLDLTEIRWINPENLEGSTGWIDGSIVLEGNHQDQFPRFTFVLSAQKGGQVQAKFFQVLLPYLPELPTKKVLSRLSKEKETVAFKNAVLRMESASANKMKVFLHILIPEYNVELNVNLEVRMEETTSFADLARMMGLLKGKP